MVMLVGPLGMTIVDERAIVPDVAGAVIDTIRAHRLDVWVYRSTEWYITDRNGPRVRLSATIRKNIYSVRPARTGDLRHGGLLESVLAVEFEGGTLEPAGRVGLPSPHAGVVLHGSD